MNINAQSGKVLKQSIAAVLICLFSFSAFTQSLDDRLDEEKFLRSLSEYQLQELLDYYMESNPPADAVSAMLFQITTQRMVLSNANLPATERIAAIEQVLKSRKQLINSNEFHPQHAVWLAEQASDMLFALYTLDATRLTCEFGLPSPTQLERAKRVAHVIVEMMDVAELEIQDAILNLEGEEGYSDNIALQLKRRKLARDERDRRIPFLLGVGCYLHAEFNLTESSEKKRRYELAAELLQPLARELDGFLRVRARLYAGLALARLGQSEDAARLFSLVAEDNQSSPQDIFATAMGQIIATSVSDSVEAAQKELNQLKKSYTAPGHIFYRVLIADREFVFLRKIAATMEENEKARTMARAFDAYIQLLEVDLGMPRDTIRPIIFSKLANAADRDMPVEKLPSIVVVARAENLARDESTRAEAIEMFRDTLQREDIDERTKSLAAFSLGRAYYADSQWLLAAQRFFQVAKEFPTDFQAEQAMEIAVALFADIYRKTSGDAEIEYQYEEALMLLLDRYINLPDIENWRYALGRLKFDQRAYKVAKIHFDDIPPGSSTWLDALYMKVLNAREYALATDEPQVRRARLEEVAITADSARLSLYSASKFESDQARKKTISYYISSLRTTVANTFIELGKTQEAIDILEGIENTTDLDKGILGEALSLRFKAYHSLGRIDDAKQEVSRFFDSIPEQVGAVVPALLGALQLDVESLIRRNRQSEALEKAKESLLPFAAELENWLNLNNVTEEESVPIRMSIADSFRLAASFDKALKQYQRVLTNKPDALQALFGEAECMFGLQKWQDAIIRYKRIAAVKKNALDDYFWQSELRVLQVLDNAERSTHQIKPRIDYLRGLDSVFGGEPFRSGFESLLVKYR